MKCPITKVPGSVITMNEKEMKEIEELFDNDSYFDHEIAIFRLQRDLARRLGNEALEMAYTDALEAIKYLKRKYEYEEPELDTDEAERLCKEGKSNEQIARSLDADVSAERVSEYLDQAMKRGAD